MTIGKTAAILKDCHIGDSIAVNGTCLTVTEFDASESNQGGYFKIGSHPKRSEDQPGRTESRRWRQLRACHGCAHKFGGHFVQGHVDTTALIRSVVPNGNALTITLRLQHKPNRCLCHPRFRPT